MKGMESAKGRIMKRIIACTLTGVLALGMVGCGSGKSAKSEEAVEEAKTEASQGEEKKDEAEGIKMPAPASKLKGKQYEDVVTQLEEAGFTNIKLKEDADLTTGWLHDDGEVSSVSVNGDDEFDADTPYKPDSKILIVYHTFAEKTEKDEASKSKEKKEESTSQKQSDESDAKESVDESAIRPEFQEAMDSYEAFFDEYVDYMKSYQNDPTNAELLMGLSDMMAKESEMLKEFDDWENDEDMTTAEAAYYLEVQSRVTAKLAEVA